MTLWYMFHTHQYYSEPPFFIKSFDVGPFGLRKRDAPPTGHSLRKTGARKRHIILFWMIQKMARWLEHDHDLIQINQIHPAEYRNDFVLRSVLRLQVQDVSKEYLAWLAWRNEPAWQSGLLVLSIFSAALVLRFPSSFISSKICKCLKYLCNLWQNLASRHWNTPIFLYFPSLKESLKTGVAFPLYLAYSEWGMKIIISHPLESTKKTSMLWQRWVMQLPSAPPAWRNSAPRRKLLRMVQRKKWRNWAPDFPRGLNVRLSWKALDVDINFICKKMNLQMVSAQCTTPSSHILWATPNTGDASSRPSWKVCSTKRNLQHVFPLRWVACWTARGWHVHGTPLAQLENTVDL